MTIKRHRIFLLLSFPFILKLIMACASPSQPMQGERWIIFTAEQVREQGIGDWFIQNGQTAEYWTPTEENILALEDGLGSYLQQANSDRFDGQKAPIWERLDEYNRQYIGLTLDGIRIIYANYFCDGVETDWKNDFVFVLDGGDCYFQFKYDPDSAEFFDLQVNGSA
jgi:hypothetical protein